MLESGFKTSPARVSVSSRYGKGTWLNVILKEGTKRQIREMGKVTGLLVVRIIRVRIGTLHMGNLKPKEWRYLTAAEVIALKKPAKSTRSGSDPEKNLPKAAKVNPKHGQIKE